MLVEVDSTRAFDYHWQLWRLFGVQAPKERTLWHRHYTLYRIVFIPYFFVFMPMTLIVDPLVSTTVASACEGLCVGAPEVFEVLKLANAWRVRGQLEESHRLLRQLDRRLRTQSEREIINATILQAKRIFALIVLIFSMIISIGLMNVIFATDRVLIFPSWLPWNYKKDRNIFLFTSLIHFLGILVCALCALNNDTFPVTYLTMVAAHLEALGLRISRIGHNRSFSQFQHHQQLIECIQDHQTILELVDIMQSSLSMAFFFQFFCTAIAQCAAIFFLAYVKTNFSRTLHMIVLIVAITNETVFICYAVEVLNHAGEMLSQGIYDCNWLDLSTRFRRDLLIMLMRSQRATSITAAGVVAVRLSTIITVVKGAYTLFTLLNEIS